MKRTFSCAPIKRVPAILREAFLFHGTRSNDGNLTTCKCDGRKHRKSVTLDDENCFSARQQKTAVSHSLWNTRFLGLPKVRIPAFFAPKTGPHEWSMYIHETKSSTFGGHGFWVNHATLCFSAHNLRDLLMRWSELTEKRRKGSITLFVFQHDRAPPAHPV